MENPLEGLNDTIVAISTPMNRTGGGIGIVRVSGNKSLAIASKLFRPIKKQAAIENRKFVLGHIFHPLNKQIVDEVFLVFMKAPRTYTREDVVEIHCHGGTRIVENVLEIVTECGARIARPGEFTMRAFINGRIDLTRAEAVLDLIQAKSKTGLRIAARQMAGFLGEKIQGLLSELTNLEISIEAQIDFPEEEITRYSANEIKSVIKRTNRDIEKILYTYRQGKGISNGFRVAIAGLPNVGKSSLMNCFLQRNRSIVSPIPGTTRDYIDETIEIDGIPVHLTDTAGICSSNDIIEKESVHRSTEKIRQSDLVILVLDSSKEMSGKEKQKIKSVFENIKFSRWIIVLNKEDIRKIDHCFWTRRHFSEIPICITSAINRSGISELSKMIANNLLDADINPGEEVVLTNARHAEALKRASSALKRVGKLINNSMTPITLIAMELNEAVTSLKEIIGIEINENILDRIFQRFCIGK